MKNISINITHTPFSRYGAHISVTKDEGTRELVVHNTNRPYFDGPTLIMTFGAQEPIDFDYECSSEKLVVKTAEGNAGFYIRDDNTLVAESFGVTIRFRMPCRNGYGTERQDGRYRVISVEQRLYVDYLVCDGNAVLQGPIADCFGTPRDERKEMTIACKEGHSLFAVSISDRVPNQIEKPIMPEQEIAAVQKEWEAFFEKLPVCGSADSEFDNFYCMTWYNLWSCYTRAAGVYQNDVMLMSKKFMSSVWSWDHCFNALAMAQISKEKAWEQFIAPFLLQLDNGALPDSWNPYLEIIYSVCKPPIHGWCFSKLMDMYEFDEDELVQVYGCLSKWTDYWLKENDSDKDGIPEYPQGCDSGWDNSSLFDLGFYLESPDLTAYLIIQMHTIARIASELSDKIGDEVSANEWMEKAQEWEKKAAELTELFYAHSWNGKRLLAKQSGSHRYEENPTSLITLLPLVMGKYLDEEKRKSLVEILKEDFLTENGLATEKPTSAKYDPDGYWRGPIWAPTTYLLVDGLRAGGEEELAKTIAEKYCHMSCYLAKGHYENFDALTGKGLRAPGYTWSASVYMLLCWEYSGFVTEENK